MIPCIYRFFLFNEALYCIDLSVLTLQNDILMLYNSSITRVIYIRKGQVKR